MDRAELEALDRESLVRRAEDAGIRRARILTRPELVDELLRLDPSIDRRELERKRGFFGRARDLLARVVERGLHLPDAADRIREIGGTLPPSVPRTDPQAVPTVTLAEIYAAQGHKQRAIETLRRVLEREPEHVAARALLAKLEDTAYVPPPPPLPPEPEIESPPTLDEEDEEEEAPALAIAPEVIALPCGPGTAFVAWRGPSSDLVLRIVVVTPSWDGPSRSTRDVALDSPEGELVLRGVPERAIVRAAIGRVEGERFVAIAHSPALEAGASLGLVRWTLRGLEPVVLDDPRSASIARAVEAAARHA
jgi:hypothetical protein